MNSHATSSGARPRTKADIVSFENESLILVDADDCRVGELDKAACHDGDGVLHRAFSLFIFNPAGELLLQQRAKEKRLWPLFWSNSCCSHPRVGESLELAVTRRLDQELGMQADLTYCYKFQYQARYESEGSEHELCSVFVGNTDMEPTVNTTEINASRWIAPDALATWLASHPEEFTPWFKMEWQTLNSAHADTLAAVAGHPPNRSNPVAKKR